MHHLDRPRGPRWAFLPLLLLSLLLFGSVANASFERSGSWYDPARDGEGFIIQYIDDSQALVYWFTFDETGAQRWFIGPATQAGASLQIDELLVTEGGVFGADFDPDEVDRIDVGELRITFSGSGAGERAEAEYTINGVAGNQSLVRLTRTVEADPSAGPRVPRKSGSWFDPSRDGEGFVLEVLPDGRPLVYWFTYDLAGRQAWMVGIGARSVAFGSTPLDLQQPVGGRFGPNFDPADVVREDAGSVRLGLQCDGAYARFDAVDTTDFSDLEVNLAQIVGIGPNRCEDPALVNLFPLAGGEAAIPDHLAGRQLGWLLDFLDSSDPISDAELQDRFAPAWFDSNGLGETRAFLEELRSSYPGGRWIDPVVSVPTQVVGVVSASNGNDFYLSLQTDLPGGRIISLGASPYGRNGTGSVIFAADASLGLEAAADRFMELSPEAGVLLARIDENHQCQPLVARDADIPRSIASVFKVFILGGVADALDDRAIFPDQELPLDGTKQVQGGPLFDQPAGVPLTVDELSTFMLGISDNTATDMLLARVGRERMDGLHAEYGHRMPELMAPQLGISEQFHLFFSFPMMEAMSYVNGTEEFQRTFLEERIVPLGSAATGGGGFFNESLLIDGAWQASPLDVCGAFARHRRHTPGSDAALVVERALQASAAQPNLRERWDRVWYKGGSLDSFANGRLVLTHAFMFEREGEAPYVLVGFSNDPSGGLEGQVFNIQSILGRLAQIAADL
ncbi:MAG: serine hydrolase [Xanthomonadales bacterium]|jgi:hypothetical protein|nr:serine hydrolase [Xanthomonadales bacterium]